MTREFWRILVLVGKGNSEKTSPYICCFFQVSLAQNDQHTKVTYFGLAYSATLQGQVSIRPEVQQ